MYLSHAEGPLTALQLSGERAIIHDYTTRIARALSDGYCTCVPHTLLTSPINIPAYSHSLFPKLFRNNPPRPSMSTSEIIEASTASPGTREVDDNLTCMYVHLCTVIHVHGKKVWAEQTKQTADRCYRPVGPHQHRVCSVTAYTYIP